MKTMFVVRGGNYFGIGKTPAEALALFKEAGGKPAKANLNEKGYAKVTVEDHVGIEIDCVSGGICHTWMGDTRPANPIFEYGKANFK